MKTKNDLIAGIATIVGIACAAINLIIQIINF